MATFGASQQEDFKKAVLAKAKGAAACTLTRWYDGSLEVESAVSFSKTDSGADSNAASFTNVLTNDVSSVFPASTYGAVKVANVAKQSSKSSLPLRCFVWLSVVATRIVSLMCWWSTQAELNQ